MKPATSPCSKCKSEQTGISTGVIYHKKRQLTIGDTKVDDPLDFQTEEVCDKCGGSGRVPYDPSTISESAPNPS